MKVSVESIELSYKTEAGELIPVTRTEKLFTPNTESKHQSRIFRQYYDIDDLPDDLIEHIYVEVIIDGKTEKVEFTLPVEKSYHYSILDVMMSI